MQVNGIILAVPWAIILWYALLRLFRGFSPSLISGLFILKIFFGFGLQLIYTYHYTDRLTADIYRFFDDGMLLTALFREAPAEYLRILFGLYDPNSTFGMSVFEQMNAWIKPHDSSFYNDNHLMIRIHAFLGLFTRGYYEVHSVIFSFLGFAGGAWLVKSLCAEKADRNAALIMSMLFPSALLWINGGLKETLLVFGMGLTLQFLLDKNTWRFEWKSFPWLMIGILVLTGIKPYFLAALIPALLVHSLNTRSSKWKVSSIAWMVVCLLFIFIDDWTQFGFIDNVVRKQHDFLRHMVLIQPGSGFDMQPLGYDSLSIILALPGALINSTLRPFPWEISQTTLWIMLFENALFVFGFSLAVGSLVFNRASISKRIWMLFFAIPPLLLIGLVTPVFGAIMRYRAPAIIMLIIFFTPYIRQSIHTIRIYVSNRH